MKGRKGFLLKKTVIAAIIFAIFFFGFFAFARILKNADYFSIKNIIYNNNDLIQLSYLKGKNIFSIDLAKESLYISKLYPVYKKIKLVRLLPHALYVDFVKRKPIAYVRLYRYFYVDDDLVLFNPLQEAKEPDLPVINGLDSRIFGAASGKKCNIAELALALNILKEAKANNGLKDYKVVRIDIANANNASFFMSQGLEIKIGADRLKEKISILSSLLNQANNATTNIKYIDLRFKETVIKLNDAKQ